MIRAAQRAFAHPGPSDEPDSCPSWMDLSRPRSQPTPAAARPALDGATQHSRVSTRSASQGHAPRPPPVPSAAAASQPRGTTSDTARHTRTAWANITHQGIPNRLKITAFLALHCQLETPSRVAYRRYERGYAPLDHAIYGSPLESACCPHPVCTGVIANASHILLDCPMVRPAAEWLCRLWGHIDDSNTAPSADHDTVIAGHIQPEWKSRRPHVDLWTKLRLIFSACTFYLPQREPNVVRSCSIW